MINKKFIKLLNELANLGLTSSSDSIKVSVSGQLIFDVLSIALDLGFILIIDHYDENQDSYSITIK